MRGRPQGLLLVFHWKQLQLGIIQHLSRSLFQSCKAWLVAAQFKVRFKGTLSVWNLNPLTSTAGRKDLRGLTANLVHFHCPQICQLPNKPYKVQTGCKTYFKWEFLTLIENFELCVKYIYHDNSYMITFNNKCHI